MLIPKVEKIADGKIRFVNTPLLKDWVRLVGSCSGVAFSPYTVTLDPRKKRRRNPDTDEWFVAGADGKYQGRLIFRLDPDGCTDDERVIEMLETRMVHGVMKLMELPDFYMGRDTEA